MTDADAGGTPPTATAIDHNSSSNHATSRKVTANNFTSRGTGTTGTGTTGSGSTNNNTNVDSFGGGAGAGIFDNVPDFLSKSGEPLEFGNIGTPSGHGEAFGDIFGSGTGVGEGTPTSLFSESELDPFGATSPMAALDFGNSVSDTNGGGNKGNTGLDFATDDARLQNCKEQKQALQTQLTELNNNLRKLTEQDAEQDDKSKARVQLESEIRELEARVEKLEQEIDGLNIFGGFTFDPAAFDPTVPTGFEGRHAAKGVQEGKEDDDELIDDSQLILPTEALVGKALPSGHEEEEELFSYRAKMHRFFDKHTYGEETRTNVWLDCGRGDCRVYRHSKTRVVRLVFRQEQTKKVKSNFRLRGALAAKDTSQQARVVIANAHSLIVEEDEYSDVADAKLQTQNLAFRFRDATSAEKLLALFAQENPKSGDVLDVSDK